MAPGDRKAPRGARELGLKNCPIWSFASPEGFVIRSAQRTQLRLFLGSSAVEHSTVNRMVAGSNPARGAKNPSPRSFRRHRPRSAQLSWPADTRFRTAG